MIYKDLKNYIPVISASGACGKFISAMITYALNDVQVDEQRVKDRFYNHAHYHREWDDIMNETNFHYSSPIEHPQWEKIKLKQESPYHSFSFAGGITLIEPERISNTFPNFKIVIITVEESDKILVDLNHFWKGGPRNYLKEDSVYFDDNNWLKNISPETARNIIEDYYSTEGMDTFQITQEALAKEWIEKLKPEWKERIYLIKFRDIVENPKKIIETIEEIVEKPLSDNLRNEYDRYVNMQKEHYKTYIPFHPSLAKPS